MTTPSVKTSSRPMASSLGRLKAFLISTLSREFELKPPPPGKRKEAITKRLEQVYNSTQVKLPEKLHDQLFQDVLDELLGCGPIQPLLDDPDVSEVMVNGPNHVYIERKGRIVKTNIRFQNDAHILRIIDRIVQPLGRKIGPDKPAVDARLPDGSRVNAIIPPVAVDGPTITIRKFTKERLTTNDLVEFGTLTTTMADFLRACVVGRLNIVISGGTGSGKTTLLNILSGFIPSDERIITIEDAAELQLHQEHVVRLETKQPDENGKGLMTIRDLVRNSLRMRPERIVVGEVRGGEALDMLQAMNTGHDGSLTTLHANAPRDALSRLETLTLMAGLDIPIRVIREQIASAVDVIVHQSRMKDGTRKVTYVTEVAGMEGDTIVMTDIFKFKQTGISEQGEVIGEMKPTGIRPIFGERLEAAGFKLGPEMFGANIAEIFERDNRAKKDRR